MESLLSHGDGPSLVSSCACGSPSGTQTPSEPRNTHCGLSVRGGRRRRGCWTDGRPSGIDGRPELGQFLEPDSKRASKNFEVAGGCMILLTRVGHSGKHLRRDACRCAQIFKRQPPTFLDLPSGEQFADSVDYHNSYSNLTGQKNPQTYAVPLERSKNSVYNP